MSKYAAKIVAVCLAGIVMTDVAWARGGRGGAGGGAARGGRPSGGGAMRNGAVGGGPSIGAGAAHGPANIGGGPVGHVGGPAQNARSLNNGNLNSFLGIAAPQSAARTQGLSSQAANFASQAQSLAAQSGFSAQAKSGVSAPAESAATQASSAAQNFASQASNYAAGQPDPFTPAWYAAHPNAFQATHPYANEAAMAAAVPNWLGVPYATTGYGVTGTGYVTVTEEPASEEEAVSESAPQSQPVAQPASAAPVADTQETLSLGVFALAQEGNKEITRMIQLAVTKDGTLKGSYYDVVSEQVHAISGSVDKSNMMATWTVSDSGKLTFQTNVNSLTQDRPVVTVRYADGKTSQWTMIRSKTAS